MSSVLASQQLTATLDRAVDASRSATFHGGILSSFPLRCQSSKAVILSRSSALPNGGFGRTRFCGQHARNALQLRVLAREATQGGSSPIRTMPSVGSGEIIVLGISPEALVTATPVGGANGPPAPVPSLLSTDMAAIQTSELNSHSLPDTQAVLASKPLGMDMLAPTVQVDVRTTIAGDGQAAMSTSRTVFATTATVVPVLSPIGLSDALGDGASDSVAASTAAVATAVHVIEQPSSSVDVAAPLDSDSGLEPVSTNAESPATLNAAPGLLLSAAPAPDQQRQQEPQLGPWERFMASFRAVQWAKVWALALLFVSYIHMATTGFALPAMLPMISNELQLTDLQGALLTTGYSYLYAIALVPIGLLADRMSRPKLLAAGLAVWSVLTCTASTCRSFGDLLLARVGFAAAQGAQNPVCFSLIPELFPVNKSTALSIYNCAIYVGRALSFAAVLGARHLHDNDQAHLAARGGMRMETRLNTLDRADLHSMSIMHTTGEMAAATPDKEFIFPLWEYGADLPDSAWRQVLRWIAVPGFFIGLALLFTLQEPRERAAAAAAAAAAPPPPAAVVVPKPDSNGSAVSSLTAPLLSATASEPSEKPAAASAAAGKPANSAGSSRSGIWALLRSPGFMSVTLAAALNDVGSYALIAWQSTFYERVYGLEPSTYAPVLAAILPIGGIIGGVGGGYLADRLSSSGRRWWVTAGGTFCAGPCLAAACLAPTPELSYAALLVGFALSEMWRAPAAVMARGIAPASMGSSASALYLCVRNLVGGVGPLAVAALIGVCGLQKAMLVVPAMYLGSGLIFAKAETLYDNEIRAQVKAAAA